MPDLLVGFGERVITPPMGIDLSGYGYYLDRKAETVLDDLKVRVLFVRQETESIALISCDLLGVTVEFSDDVRKKIAAKHAMPIQNILLACTHTHSGPAVQPLRGLGEIDTKYREWVVNEIVKAVESAVHDQDESVLCYGSETIEPIGYNRRNGNFGLIDPVLKIAVFKRPNEKIYLLNYPCHPVTLGPTREISADWPGAVITEIERHGHRGIFFQGFCGDIDPVSNLNRWGKGSSDDLRFYGESLCRRAFMAERYAATPAKVELRAVERRIDLPLDISCRETIERDKETWLRKYENDPSWERFVREWIVEAVDLCEKLKGKPCLPDVPVQAIVIGGVYILGLPGEIFCRYSLRLRRRWPLLFTLGYAGGNIGYLPTADAYAAAGDYACYGAPGLYHLPPFTKEVEEVVLRECEMALLYVGQDH